MQIKTALRCGLRALLYFAAFVVLLSTGLRIYSARQIPKAKRLLREMSLLRATQSTDERVRLLMLRYNFRHDQSCAGDDCWYYSDIAGVPIAQRNQEWNQRIDWLDRHGFFLLGLRPWGLSTWIKIGNNRIENAGYRLLFADRTLIGSGATIGAVNSMGQSDESQPDYRIHTGGRFGEHIIRVEFSPQASESYVSSAFSPDFSCAWAWHDCNSGWEVFPKLKEQYQVQESAYRQLRAETSDNPCPLQNMYSRVRDSGDVAIAKVSRVEKLTHYDGIIFYLSGFEYLMRENASKPNLTIDSVPEKLGLADLNAKLFPTHPKVGDKVVLFAKSLECQIVPGTIDNIQAARSATAKLNNLQ